MIKVNKAIFKQVDNVADYGKLAEMMHESLH
jgi:hypothetical protein